ncbi:hypothetical protein HMI55_001271 [Coelomomyces lativittatus]|nr:hypothetical protein HMI55_001271 [Coelomomyces lativittatus]
MSTLSSSKSRKLNTSTSLEKNDLFLMLTSFLENPFSTLLQWLWTLLLLLLFHPWVYHLGHGLKLVGQVVLLISNVYTLPRTFCKCISFLHLYVRQQYPLEPGKVILKSLIQSFIQWGVMKPPFVNSFFSHVHVIQKPRNSSCSSIFPTTTTQEGLIQKKKNGLSTPLPVEVVMRILVHSTPEAIFHFGLTNRFHYQLATSSEIWISKLKLDYPIPTSRLTLSSISPCSQYKMYREAVYFHCACTLCQSSILKKPPWAFYDDEKERRFCSCLAHLYFPNSWWVPFFHHSMCSWKERNRGISFLLHQESKVAWFHFHHVIFTPFKLLALAWLPLMVYCAYRFRPHQRFGRGHAEGLSHLHGIFAFYAKEIFQISSNWCTVWNIHWLTLIAPFLVVFVTLSELFSLFSIVTSTRPFRSFFHARTFTAFLWFFSLLFIFLITWLFQKALWNQGKIWSHRMVSNLFLW